MSTPHQDLWSPEEEEAEEKACQTRGMNVLMCMQIIRLFAIHVLDSAAEGVGDCSIMDGLFA